MAVVESLLPVVVTCEHGGRRVPRRYRALFRGRERVLRSHRGYDAGALALARFLSRRLGAPLFAATVTRLVVDLNRSPHNPAVFSKAVKGLERREREELLARLYWPYRRRVARAVEAAIASGRRVLHLSVHSFTPVLRGARRRTDIGLLYDPRRAAERILCRRWQRALARALPELRVRRNDPYRGAADGHTAALRRDFGGSRYLGIELEVNRRLLRASGGGARGLGEALLGALSEAAGR